MTTRRDETIYDYGYREGYCDSREETINLVGEILAGQVEALELGIWSDRDKQKNWREAMKTSARALIRTLKDDVSFEDFEHLFGGAFWTGKS